MINQFIFFKPLFKSALLVLILGMIGLPAFSQSTTSASGSWNTASNWSGGVPGSGTNATINHSMTLDVNLVLNQGDYTINSPVTDVAGGTAYTLSVSGGGSNKGNFIVDAKTVFEGACNINGNGILTVKSGDTLIVGVTTFANGSLVVVEAGATLIINGNLTNNNNSDGITINGTLIVNGNFTGGNGSAITGTGSFDATGTITTTGSGSVFGSENDCSSGPCSGNNLCVSNTIASAQTICSGATPAQLTGSAHGGYTYQWQQSTTSSSTGFANVSSGTGATSQNYTPAALTQSTWFRRRVSSGGCTATSVAVKITVTTVATPTISAGSTTTFCSGCSVVLTSSSASGNTWSTGATTQSITVTSTGNYTVTVTSGGCTSAASSATSVTVNACSFTWTGSTSNAFGTASNWNKCTVPGTSDDVTIASTATSPVVSGTNSVKALTIDLGASLTINSGATLNVAGNITKNGTLTANGTVVLNGTSSQTIGGTNSFNNLTLNNSNGAVLSNATIVGGILTLTSGNLTSNGNLTVRLGTGAIAGTGTGGIVGNITVTKTVNGAKYHYLSSPLNGQTAAAINDDIPIGTNKLYWYNEGTVSTDNQVGWTKITNTATSLNTMQGYAIYSFNAVNYLDFTGTYSHTTTPSFLGLTYTNSGVTGSDGWHLVGNPYPSALDWEAASGWTKVNLDDAIYYWNPVTSSYAAYVSGVGNNGGTQYIPSLQGFWVKVSGAGGGTLGMNNNVRTTASNPATWKVAATQKSFCKVTVVSGNLKDEAIIRFADGASDSYDAKFDAYKLKNEGMPNIFTKMGSDEFAINSVSDTVEEYTIPLKVVVKTDGNYLLTFDNSSLDPSYELTLEDQLLDNSSPLGVFSSYECNLTAGDTTSRFYIKAKKALKTQVPTSVVTPIHATEDIKLSVSENLVQIEFVNGSASNANIGIYSTVGQTSYYQENIPTSSGIISIPVNEKRGIYVVSIQVGNQTYTEKIYIP